MKKFMDSRSTAIVGGLLQELIKRLGEEEVARRLLNCDPLPSSLADEMTVQLGLENSPEAYHAALLRSNVRVGMSARDMLKCVAVSRRKVSLDL